MNIYEIDNAIMDCVDMDTGEVIDINRLEELQMVRDEKVENVALWIKELSAEIEGIKAESKRLSQRKVSAENKIKSLKKYLVYALDGKKFKTARASVSFRKSQAVEVSDINLIPAEYLTFAEPKPNKTEIKKAIKEGKEVGGCSLVENTSVVVG